MSITERIGGFLLTRTSRRSFLAKSAMTATALSVAPVDYLVRPGTAYAQICQCVPGTACDCSSTCCNGYTDFCCTINNGVNACPPGTFAGGWWKADGSIYCAGPRYYIDCMGECRGCGCGGGSFCPSCDGLSCECALGSCSHYHVGCAEFRYGQCNQQISCSGRISCRMVSCTPPWLIDPSCSTVSQTDDNTANQNAPCLEAAVVPSPKPVPTYSAPAAVVNSASSMHVFYVTSAGQIVNEYWSPAGWGRQILPGAARAGSRLSAVVNSRSLMHVFYETPGGQIGNNYWTPSGGWVAQTLSGVAKAGSGPAAVVNSASSMHVFYVSPSGQIVNEYWSPAGWASQILPGAARAGSTLSAVVNSRSLMHVFYETPGGQIGNNYWTPSGGWVAQTLSGVAKAGSGPAAVVNSASSMHVFYVSPSGQIVNEYWSPAGWASQILPGAARAGSTLSAVVNSPSLMHVFYETPGGQIGNNYWTPSGGWVPQIVTGAAKAASGPAAVVNSASSMHVFYVSTEGRIVNDYWSPGGWASQVV